MNLATKQRIVGSIVLLALGLIFLPIVFDGEGSYQAPVSSRIPERPVLPPPVEIQATRPNILSDQNPVSGQDGAPEDDAQEEAITETAAQSEPLQSAEGSRSEAAPVENEPTLAEIVESEPVYSRALPVLDEETGLPQGWSVRLGSFADARNATNLTQRLQEAGYKAYSRETENAQGLITIVFVGPWLDRVLADDYLRQLEEEFELSGMVVRYDMQRL